MVDGVNPVTGMTLAEMKEFIRHHFEEFVNRKNLDIAYVNFAPEFVDHGSDVPAGTLPGPEGARQYVGSALQHFPDMHITIEDMVAEGDKVLVRNLWVATHPANGQKIAFRGMVLWRIANRQIHERWAYLEAPHPA